MDIEWASRALWYKWLQKQALQCRKGSYTYFQDCLQQNRSYTSYRSGASQLNTKNTVQIKSPRLFIQMSACTVNQKSSSNLYFQEWWELYKIKYTTFGKETMIVSKFCPIGILILLLHFVFPFMVLCSLSLCALLLIIHYCFSGFFCLFKEPTYFSVPWRGYQR